MINEVSVACREIQTMGRQILNGRRISGAQRHAVELSLEPKRPVNQDANEVRAAKLLANSLNWVGDDVSTRDS
jgi:hypothetical protein